MNAVQSDIYIYINHQSIILSMVCGGFFRHGIEIDLA